ncbi:MAG: hypothetical protein ACYS1C_09030 [Planctomycetota bacterium]|jgi:hypothetical protein
MAELDYRILQIIPAHGWVAVYEESGEPSRSPLACFALIELPDGNRLVVGVDQARGTLALSEVNTDFLGYAHVGAEALSDMSDFRLEARRREMKKELSTRFE